MGKILEFRGKCLRLLHIPGPQREFRQLEHDMLRVRCALHRKKKDLLRLLQFPVLLINIRDKGKKVHVRDPSPVDIVSDLHCRLVVMKIILFPHLIDLQIELVFIHCHRSCLFRFCRRLCGNDSISLLSTAPSARQARGAVLPRQYSPGLLPPERRWRSGSRGSRSA